jgi:protein-S-isoprenylcysteine O-methyltransferase Ste14
MAWLALALYIVGLALALGWRTAVHWRRTGDTGLRLDAGRPGTLRWCAKLLFLAAVALGFAGPIASLAGVVDLPGLRHSSVHRVGLILAIAGIAATLAAQLAMVASWRIGVDPAERTTLVTDGPFAVARNPIFTAMAATSLGLALTVPNPAAVTAWIVLLVAVQLQVRVVEEPTYSPATTRHTVATAHASAASCRYSAGSHTPLPSTRRCRLHGDCAFTTLPALVTSCELCPRDPPCRPGTA